MLLSLLLVGCDDRYGTYLRVDGHGEIAFDRVEFYFADAIGAEVPLTPGHATAIPDAQLLGRRLIVDSDVQLTDGSVDTWSYYLPPVGQNERLGDYVLAIAYAGDQPVGIGEVFRFRVSDEREVVVYTLPLVAYAGEDVERWGRTQPDCVLWRRVREAPQPQAVAIVRDNDSDCDDFPDRDDAIADCLPLEYCDGTGGTGCVGRVSCFTEATGACQAGSCVNTDGAPSSCTGTSCANDLICSGCDLAAPPDELLACALLLQGTHEDYPIVVKPTQALCFEPQAVELVLPFPCKNPRIEASVNFNPAPTFGYTIAQTTGNTCLLDIRPPTPGATFDGLPHVLISVDSLANAQLRTAFIVGLSIDVGICDMTQLITPTAGLTDCAP